MSRDDQLAQGVLELHSKGFGFLRNAARNYLAQPGDAYVATQLIQKHHLRAGELLAGPTEPGKKGSGPRLVRVETIEGQPAAQHPRRKFDDLTPIDPTEQIVPETG